MKVKKKQLRFFGIGRILPFLRDYRKLMAAMVICGLISTAMDISVPVFQRYALNHFISENTLDTLPVFTVLYVLVLLVAAAVNYVSCSNAMAVEVGVNKTIRNRLFSHLQTLSFSFFNQNSVGYIHARIMSDSSRIGTLVSWNLMDCVWHLSYLAGAVAVMLAINFQLALTVIVILPVLAVLFAFFQKKYIAVNREVREINSIITSDFNEGITGAKTIKSLVIEDKMTADFMNDTAQMKKKSVKAARLKGVFSSVMGLASSTAVAIVLWQGGYIAESEVGTFSMFMTFAQGMMEPIRWVIDAVSAMITTQVNIERITAMLETESDVTDTQEVIEKYGDSFSPKRENWEEIKGDIEFRNVDFRYPDGDETVLSNFSLKIPFGSSVAIVGETGAGKSTLVNLICRFYEPTSGQVLIDGRDAQERSQLWLHSAIGYVLQSPHLFSGTIRDNLLYGNPDASDDEIMKALELVSADGFVNNLEKGLDTDVGESGGLLSTGEKQLISFARAILSNPKILILDEATSSVDTLTEARLQRAVDAVIKGRTSVVIAHRLSTIRGADVILAVRDGRIAEQGTHAELMKMNGYYAGLYRRQYEDEAAESAFNR